VELSRCSRGIVVLIIFFGVFALLFDAFPAVVAAGALSFFLIARSVLFLHALQSLITGLDLERSVSPLLVRQGSPITVETRVNAVAPRGLLGKITDLIPHGTVVSSGSAAGIIPGGQSPDLSISYTMTPFAVGNHPFRGISIQVSDQFFSTSLTHSTKNAANPSITILPSSGYALTERDVYGEAESRVMTPLPGSSVRSFRAYVPGDDLRKIDWKLSAKHDSLFIREFMGKAEHATLFIIDLPDATLPVAEKSFERLKEAIVGAFTMPALSSRTFSVILISGSNVVTSKVIKPELPGLSGLMKHLTPTNRPHSLYRTSSIGALKRHYDVREIPEIQFGGSLRRISTAFLSHRPAIPFESQIDRIFQSVPASTVHLFSLADHDESHLRLLSERAAMRGMDIVLHIPKECYSLRTRVKLKQCRFSSIEVF
jgi:hypothetical protein